MSSNLRIIKVIRLHDVISKVDSSIKETTDLILKSILKMNICDRKIESNIRSYLKGVELRNQKKADNYIKRRRLNMVAEKGLKDSRRELEGRRLN